MTADVLTAHVVADARTADTLARAQFAHTARSALTLSLVVVLLMAALAVIAPETLVWVAVFSVYAAVIIALMWHEVRRVTRATWPEGEQMSARYDAVAVQLITDESEAFVPYALLSDVRQHGDAVLLRRISGPAIVLPAAVCPPEAQERIRAGIAAGILPALDPAQFAHQGTADAGFIAAITRVSLRGMLASPLLWMLGGSVLLAQIAVSVALGDPVPAILGALLVLISPIMLVLAVRKTVRFQLAGTVLAGGADADGITVAEGATVQRFRYRAFDRVELTRGAVALRLAASRQVLVLPASVIPDAATVRARVAASPLS